MTEGSNGEPPLPSLEEYVECWSKADDQFRLREQTFTTRTANLAGAHCERFENRLENIKRTSNSTIPHYNVKSDPHLVRYRRAMLRSHSNSRPSTADGRGSAKSSKVLAIRDRVKGERSEDDIELCVVTPPLGTDHVLQLKKLFWNNSCEFSGLCCRSTYCGVASAGLTLEKIRVIDVKAINFHELVCKGISITNGFCALHEQLPVPLPSMPLLFDWLVVLNCLETVDWPAFLLLCTANLRKEWTTVARLKNSYQCFVQQKPPASETAFHELVAFLHYNHGHHVNDTNARLTSFFQPGDFYRARHICNFSEAIFALQPRRIQFYLYKANARGQRLEVNFCGHTSVTTNPVGLRPDEAMAVATERARRMHSALPPPPLALDRQISSRKEILQKQSYGLRYNRRVWA
jgi:hypothetical protein